MSDNRSCIYCPQTDPVRFCGVEHVIPQAFGRFGSDTPTLDCVCDDCNAFFGRELDQLLAREATSNAFWPPDLQSSQSLVFGVTDGRIEHERLVKIARLHLDGVDVLIWNVDIARSQPYWRQIARVGYGSKRPLSVECY